MTLFDAYVVVDWSSRNTPATGADSIWIAVAVGGRPVALANPPTRRAAEVILRALVAEHRNARLLIGIDAALGYPQGTADEFRLPGEPPWLAMWDAVAVRVTDDERNRNNRFDVAAALNRRSGGDGGPFWGCPRTSTWDHLAPTKPATPGLPEYRATESTLRAAGFRPASVWQLLGAGSVGGQTLTLLPVVRRLLGDLAGRVTVWPFTTGLARPAPGPGDVVLAEVWPTRFEAGRADGHVRDALQVEATAGALRRADAAGDLAGWFEPRVDAEVRRIAELEEGWVLGPGVS